MMPIHLATCQFKRDPAMEHLASTSVEADAEAVLFSWTDQEGRGYEVLLREVDRLVATLRCDGQEFDVATDELDLQCRALGLTWETAASMVDAAWTPPAAGVSGFFAQGLNTMAIDSKDHPLHQVPDDLPVPPGSAPQPAGAVPPPPGPYAGEIEDEAGDPVGKPPRM
ncbi:MAG: hypothetical protein V4679_09350 [Pseudomonadota bacterium]